MKDIKLINILGIITLIVAASYVVKYILRLTDTSLYSNEAILDLEDDKEYNAIEKLRKESQNHNVAM
jgi:hypothetical protein